MGKKWVRLLFRRRIAVAFLLLLQAGLMAYAVYSSGQAYKWIYNGLTLISFLVVLHVISATSRPSYKLLWSVIVLAAPLFGGLLYLFCRFQGTTEVFRKRLFAAGEYTKAYKDVALAPSEDSPFKNQCHYLTKTCGFPLYTEGSVTYFPLGDDFYEPYLEALNNAKRFIFMEYFIIEEGRLWNSVLEILEKKAREGVDVRLIYDDLGCFMLLPAGYEKSLGEKGIRCRVFNRFRPILSTLQNNRNHRKITVIDGEIAFTGGINLADEYINQRKKHGHWKDSAVSLTGNAVTSFTLMFLELWQALTGEKDTLSDFIVQTDEKKEDALLIPYCDSPIDKEYVGEQVYANLINGAKDYLYIETPYLILDDTLVSLLILAAKRGVRVTVLTPGIGDKWYVHLTTRSFYKELIEGGVEVYEYTPGFIHSKVMVADDTVATVGTINLDCRSLYLHFECGLWFANHTEIPKIRLDFEKTLESSKKIGEKDCQKNIFVRLLQRIFRLFAPLM